MNRCYMKHKYAHRHLLVCKWVQLAGLEHQVCVRAIESLSR